MNESYTPPTTPQAITERKKRMESRGDDKLMDKLVEMFHKQHDVDTKDSNNPK